VVAGFFVRGIALVDRSCNGFPNRSPGRAVRISPEEAVMFSGSANDLLCILIDAGVVVSFRSVFSLRFYESSANLDGIEFIGANPALEDLIVPLLCIEMPPAVCSHQGNRHRPVVSSNTESGAGGVLRI